MPKKDKYHDLVIRALQKDGWILIKEQVMLYVESRILKVDLHLQRQREEILVEVKSFDSGSPVIDITEAVGKYTVYHAILEDNQDNRPLYLAIPRTAYEGIFSERLGELLRSRHKLKLIVYDVLTETIIAWLP